MKHLYFFKYLFLLILGVSSAVLNGQETYTFTSAGSEGNTGPTQVQINTAYSATNLDGQVVINTQGIQEWTVPVSGLYRIQTVGATGGNQNEATRTVGHPANMNGEFNLIAGDVIKVLVGQKGFLGTLRPGWGGGGGTFVTRSDNSPLIVAGGSGSGHTSYTTQGMDAQNASLTTQGKNGSSGTGVWPDGMGAIGGSGGDGAGLNGDGTIGGGGVYLPLPLGLTVHTIPQAFINGGKGDEFGGGFGGGGGVTNTYGGGAGGYSGGQGGVSSPYSGGGGGSFNSGDNQDNYLDTNDEFTMADGSVVITQLCSDEIVITEAPSKAVCDKTMITLTAMSINGGVISWDNDVTNGEPFEITTTTTFNATSSHPDDCGTSVTIIVLTNTADISNHPDSQDDVVEGTDVNFRITATGGSLEYRWRKNGVKLSNGENITGAYLPVLSINGVTDADEGDYDCVVYGSCVVLVSQKASLTVVGSGDDGTATALDELAKEGISVYPNPSNGIFTIQLKDFTDKAIVSIFDFSGKTVYKKIADNDKISVDISEKPAGIYFIRLELDDRIIESKMVLK